MELAGNKRCQLDQFQSGSMIWIDEHARLDWRNPATSYVVPGHTDIMYHICPLTDIHSLTHSTSHTNLFMDFTSVRGHHMALSTHAWHTRRDVTGMIQSRCQPDQFGSSVHHAWCGLMSSHRIDLFHIPLFCVNTCVTCMHHVLSSYRLPINSPKSMFSSSW